MANALTWYIGASTRTVWGRATGRHCSIIGVLKTSLYTAGSAADDHLRRPVDPLLQMPIMRGDTTSGSSGTSASAVPRIHGEVVVAEMNPGPDHLPKLVELPVRQVPADRDRRGAELPAREGRDDQLRGVPQPERHPVAHAQRPSRPWRRPTGSTVGRGRRS